MKRKELPKSGTLSDVWQILIGVLLCVTIGLIGTAMAALLMGKGSLGENRGDISAVVIAFVSSSVGVFSCLSFKKGKYLLRGLICSAGYMFVLAAINIVVFDGVFSGFLKITLSALIGSVLCALLKSKIDNGIHRTKFRVG